MKENIFEKFSQSVTVENMSQQVRWLISLRWIAGTCVVIFVLAGKAFFNLEPITIPLLLGFATLLYNVIFLIITNYFCEREKKSTPCMRRRLVIINSLIFLDLVVLGALVYFTGGITNPLLFFFVFHMVISSILLSRRNAYLWAIFTIVMESALFYLEHHHHIPSWHFFPFYPAGLVNSGAYVFLTALAFSVTLLITVYFATTIVRPIRKRQLDLTELQKDLHKQKDELELKNKELQELDHSKTEFLYRVEHELKAPIGALQSLLSVVSRGYSSVSDEKKKEFLARAARRVSTMKELVTDLLSLSRVSERSFHLELETLRLESLTKEVIDELAVYASRKGIKIKSHFAEPLPEIRADKQAMLEVARNLIHNAVKYSFQGEVNVALIAQGNQVVFRVEDNGIGISEEDIGNIFKEFYRTANARAFEEGTGLGLSLVKYLIEQHGGTISVSSQLDRGTTFTVMLPVGLN